MSKTVLYAGPSLYGIEEWLVEGLIVKGPCKQSDLFEDLSDSEVKDIIVADGLYKTIPAPWHKEFLLTLEAGKNLYGVSSLGALRASELDCFGMKGYGKVYEYFKGEIRDDSDVALLHMGEDERWKPTTVAFVEIYFWLKRLEDVGLIDRDTRNILTEKERSCYFEQRTWGKVKRDMEKLIGPEATRRCINSFKSQKRYDLESLLRMYRLGEMGNSSKAFDFDVAWTPYIPRQLSKDSRVLNISRSSNHANTVSNFMIFCFLRSPGVVHELYLKTWTRSLEDDIARLRGATSSEECEVSSRICRQKAVKKIIRPKERSISKGRSVKDRFKSEWLYDSMRRYKEIQCKSSLHEGAISKDSTLLFTGAAIEWLDTVRKVRKEQICSHVFKSRYQGHIVDCVCRGESIDIEREESMFMLLEFLAGNVLFHSYGRNGLFEEVLACDKYEEWVKEWNTFLVQEGELKPHALYIDAFKEEEAHVAVKKVKSLLNMNLFWINNPEDVLGLYFHDMWQFTTMYVCMERSQWL